MLYVVQQRRKERGRVPVAAIHTVEQAQLGELSKQLGDIDGEKGLLYKYPFQVNDPAIPIRLRTGRLTLCPGYIQLCLYECGVHLKCRHSLKLKS